MIGEALSAAGIDVVIVDRRGPVQGSTAASRALVAYELDAPLIELRRKIGKRNAMRAWQRSRLAVASLRALLRERCLEAQARDSLYLAGTSLGADDLRREDHLKPDRRGRDPLALTREPDPDADLYAFAR